MIAWAALLIDAHVESVYPLLLPALVVVVFALAVRWRVWDWRGFVIAGLTLCYGAYVVVLLAGAAFLAWQFSGGGGPLLPVRQMLLPVSLVLGAAAFAVWLVRGGLNGK